MNDTKAAKVLSVEEMMAAEDIQYATVEAFGGLVRIGSIEAGQMIEFVEANEGPAKRTAGLRLIIQSIVDKDGNRIGEMNQLAQWKKRSQKTCNIIIEAIFKLNGMKLPDQKALGNASGEVNSDASPSD